MSQNCTKKPRNVDYVGLNFITKGVLYHLATAAC